MGRAPSSSLSASSLPVRDDGVGREWVPALIWAKSHSVECLMQLRHDGRPSSHYTCTRTRLTQLHTKPRSLYASTCIQICTYVYVPVCSVYVCVCVCVCVCVAHLNLPPLARPAPRPGLRMPLPHRRHPPHRPRREGGSGQRSSGRPGRRLPGGAAPLRPGLAAFILHSFLSLSLSLSLSLFSFLFLSFLLYFPFTRPDGKHVVPVLQVCKLASQSVRYAQQTSYLMRVRQESELYGAEPLH